MYHNKIFASVAKLASFDLKNIGVPKQNVWSFHWETIRLIINSNRPKNEKLKVIKKFVQNYPYETGSFSHEPIHLAKIFRLIETDKYLVSEFLKMKEVSSDFLSFLNSEERQNFIALISKHKAFYFFSFKDILKIINPQNCNEIMARLIDDKTNYLALPGSSRTAVYIVLNHAKQFDLLNMYKEINGENLNRLMADERDTNWRNGFFRVFNGVQNDYEITKRLFRMVDFEILCKQLSKIDKLNSAAARPMMLNIVLALKDDKELLEKLILAAKKSKHIRELTRLIETRGVGMKEKHY